MNQVSEEVDSRIAAFSKGCKFSDAQIALLRNLLIFGTFEPEAGRPIVSVQPEWCRALPIQQQSVLFLAARGPDGIAKNHPVKRIQRAYRGTVLVAAKYGRCLKWGEKADSFMGLDDFADSEAWRAIIEEFFLTADSLPHHFYMHLIHGAEILGYKQAALDYHIEEMKRAGTEEKVLLCRLRFYIGVPGFIWTGRSVAGMSPTNEELAIRGNWEDY